MHNRATIVMPLPFKVKAVARARQRAVEKQLAVPAKNRSKQEKTGKKKTSDPFWDNLVTYDDDGPTDLAARHDDYLYGE